MSLSAVAIAERKYGVRFVKAGRNEYRSIDGCPKCGTSGPGTDRFRLFIAPRGKSNGPRVWCRRCGFFEYLDKDTSITRDDIRRLKQEIRKRERDEIRSQFARLRKIQASNVHLKYHDNLNREALEYFFTNGIEPDAIEKYLLGYCESCPTAPGHSSFTIPVMYQGKLWNVRHRLQYPNGSGKYRPEMRGLPPILFNADALHSDSKEIIILEGEKKQIVVSQYIDIPSVAVMGDSAFQERWGKYFAKFDTVYIVFDPDSIDKAVNVANMLPNGGTVVSLPVKADDFFYMYGGSKDDFLEFMRYGVHYGQRTDETDYKHTPGPGKG